jgi:2-C-methyl-D-erythritol 4-phosphate cytidylyltransferase/2-C-methyl-D-erythritol 2,4-cyclodiphosphate synthase
MQLAAILVAAGTGSRFGAETPKQFLTLLGQPVIRHAALALIEAGAVIQPVGDSDLIDAALNGLPHLPTVPGGVTRQDSVRAGLLALRAHAPDFVLVHDAARPVIPPGTVPALLAALAHAPGAIPGAPVADTLKRVETGQIVATVPRNGLFRAQTPQAFRFDALFAAHHAEVTGATDDASLLEALGLPVAIVAGSEANIKLTYPEDLARLEAAM